MNTLKNANQNVPINAIIGSNNQNVNFYNTNEKLLQENTFLKQENEKLRGLLTLAISYLETKDQLIKIFKKRWTGL